jgi:peptidoglycan hydrolase-like protein with peptidoglycan-binding domain
VILALLAFTAPAVAAADPGPGTGANDRGHALRVDWSAGPVAQGTGYARPGGSRRVREVQRTLRSRGYHPGPVDGLYGPRTERAVRRFQRAHDLRPDAIVGPRTLHALRTPPEAPAPPAVPQSLPSPPTVHASPTAAPEPAPFPLPVILALLGAAGLAVATQRYVRTRRTVLRAAAPPHDHRRGEAAR